MGQHPLIELAESREVKQAAGFRAAASELTGEKLAELYQLEKANAPHRMEAGKRYFVSHNTKLASERRPGRDSEHVAIAVVAHCKETGARLRLPRLPGESPDEESNIEFIHPLVPLKSAQPDKARGVDDPNYGVDRIDLLGIGPEDRMAVVGVRYLAPDAKRIGVGDTPLRALLEGLANCAIAEANREALREEIAAAGGRSVSEEPPLLGVLGSTKFWELSRKREAQKGAAWIKEMERLGAELNEALGLDVRFLSLRLDGNPGWHYPEASPVLQGTPSIGLAWEVGAGRVRPKPKPKPKVQDPADVVVEADLSRPIRSYAISETFAAGDRIEHPTLGLGVVQGEAGAGKIRVLFDGDRKSLLVHGRRRSGPSPSVPA